MGESTVTVATVETKTAKNGQSYKAFIDGDGQSWNVFPWKVKDVHLITPGNVLKLTWEQAGKYKNIEGIEFVDKVEPPKPVRPQTPDEDQAWTNCRTAVMQILECWRAGKLKDDDPLVTEAQRILMVWLYSVSRGGVMPYDEPKEMPVMGSGGRIVEGGTVQQPQGMKRVGQG